MKTFTVAIHFLALIFLWGPVQSAPLPGWFSDVFPSSSNYNAQIANQNYPHDTIQRWVAKSLGDEIPNMRDDLIRRKNEGQGVIGRHWGAWTTANNWKVDSNYQNNQNTDPFKYSPMDTLGITTLTRKTKSGIDWLGSKVGF